MSTAGSYLLTHLGARIQYTTYQPFDGTTMKYLSDNLVFDLQPRLLPWKLSSGHVLPFVSA